MAEVNRRVAEWERRVADLEHRLAQSEAQRLALLAAATNDDVGNTADVDGSDDRQAAAAVVENGHQVEPEANGRHDQPEANGTDNAGDGGGSEEEEDISALASAWNYDATDDDEGAAGMS